MLRARDLEGEEESKEFEVEFLMRKRKIEIFVCCRCDFYLVHDILAVL